MWGFVDAMCMGMVQDHVQLGVPGGGRREGGRSHNSVNVCRVLYTLFKRGRWKK